MLYIDSADRSELAALLSTGLFAGVTTNPKILAASDVHLADIAGLVDWVHENGGKRVFAQAVGLDEASLRASARALVELPVTVKLVCTLPGLTVARELADEGHQVLLTAVYHPGQMLLAEAAGAAFVAPYVGRSDDQGRDGIGMVRMMSQLLGRRPAGVPVPRVVAASLRSPDQVAALAVAGADDFAISPLLARQMADEQLTCAAAEEFDTIHQRQSGQHVSVP